MSCSLSNMARHPFLVALALTSTACTPEGGTGVVRAGITACACCYASIAEFSVYVAEVARGARHR
ncbi:MAG: hypothetical protein IPK33_13000 [Gemmatimonadetes bacterium]|nr:hypothetical protein [Gemmatimonadota bacterium]